MRVIIPRHRYWHPFYTSHAGYGTTVGVIVNYGRLTSPRTYCPMNSINTWDLATQNMAWPIMSLCT